MNIGKLTNSELEALILSKFRKTRKEVKYPPMVGIDCAQVDVGGVCVLSSDPITAATSRIPSSITAEKYRVFPCFPAE